MYCVKCGREVPDGVKICQICAEQQMDQTELIDDQAPTPVREHKKSPKETEGKQPKKQANKLMIPFLVVCALLIGACVFTLNSYRQISVQKANYRAKEASLSSREKELTSLQTDYDTVCAELETAKGTIEEQATTITSLEKKITTLEGSASQNEYDITEMQKTLEQNATDIATLTSENETLKASNSTLTTEKANLAYELQVKATEITSLEGQLSTMTTNYNTAQAKVDFMNSYVVFVNNDGSDLYHKYDCANFAKSNFWAYSPKLAENYDYAACPNCCG